MNADVIAALREQYEAFQAGRGVIELANWTSVAVTGADRAAFLHNFCTNDIKRLSTGESCEAFFTNVKGRIIGHGLVTCRENELVVVCEPDQATPLVAHLDRYVIREDVQLRDDTADRSYLLVGGQTLPAHRFETANYVTGWYAAQGLSFRLIEVLASNLQRLNEELSSNGLIHCDQAFEIVRIEAGIPLFGVDFDDRNFPQEVGRNNDAISFTKGCYLGQETVARIDALGHVNQQLVGARFSGEVVPEKGTQLTHSGKPAGQVTSAIFSLKLQASLALAMVRREQTAIGTRLDSPIGPCEIVSLPV
jgi:folate-binding protein YgfZ